MSHLEGIFLWTAIGLYVLAFALSLLGMILRWQRAARAEQFVWPLALLLHFAAGITRWAVTGHAPVMGSYENSLAGTFFIGLIFLPLYFRLPQTKKGLPLVLAGIVLLLGLGLQAPQSLIPLEPPFRSGWLGVHVAFAWLAFGSYLVASATAAMVLVSSYRKEQSLESQKKQNVLDDLTGRLIAFGFVSDTVMIASGAIWAHGLWGRYWAWDPIETWSLISWLIYGVNLHLRFTMGWKGRRAAWLAVASVLGIIVTFFGIGVISDVHTELL